MDVVYALKRQGRTLYDFGTGCQKHQGGQSLIFISSFAADCWTFSPFPSLAWMPFSSSVSPVSAEQELQTYLTRVPAVGL